MSDEPNTDQLDGVTYRLPPGDWTPRSQIRIGQYDRLVIPNGCRLILDVDDQATGRRFPAPHESQIVVPSP